MNPAPWIRFQRRFLGGPGTRPHTPDPAVPAPLPGLRPIPSFNKHPARLVQIMEAGSVRQTHQARRAGSAPDPRCEGDWWVSVITTHRTSHTEGLSNTTPWKRSGLS